MWQRSSWWPFDNRVSDWRIAVSVSVSLSQANTQRKEKDPSREDEKDALSTTRKIETHDTRVGLEETRVHGPVCGAARVWLHVHAPLLWIDVEGLLDGWMDVVSANARRVLHHHHHYHTRDIKRELGERDKRKGHDDGRDLRLGR